MLHPFPPPLDIDEVKWYHSQRSQISQGAALLNISEKELSHYQMMLGGKRQSVICLFYWLID